MKAEVKQPLLYRCTGTCINTGYTLRLICKFMRNIYGLIEPVYHIQYFQALRIQYCLYGRSDEREAITNDERRYVALFAYKNKPFVFGFIVPIKLLGLRLVKPIQKIWVLHSF